MATIQPENYNNNSLNSKQLIAKLQEAALSVFDQTNAQQLATSQNLPVSSIITAPNEQITKTRVIFF